MTELLADDELGERCRQHTFRYALVAAATGWVSAAVHFSTGASQRALFTAAIGSFFGLVALILRSRPRASFFAAHSVLALSVVALILSPITAKGSVPIFLGLAAIPFAATLTTGYRGGLLWTAICGAVLMASAALVPLEPGLRPLAWNTAIIAVLIGGASAWMDRSREQAETAASQESTSLSRAEARLEQRDALLATIFRRSPAILVLYDLSKAAIVEINERCERAVGWDREQAIGQSLDDLEIWTNSEDAQRLLHQILSNQSRTTFETRIQTRQGNPLDLLATVESIEIDDRPHLLISALDVSEQKRERERDRTDLERTVEDQSAALEISRSQLQRQHRLASIGTLAAGIAHEINNPVGAIRMMAEVELTSDNEGAPTSPQVLDAFKDIIEEADRCGEIVRGVLQFSRDEPMSKWAGDLNEAVNRSCHNIRPSLARLNDANLEMHLAEMPLSVMMNPIGIDQILSNLLRNASESADVVNVRVETSRGDGVANLSITDNGRGMDESDVRRAFDPFFTTRLGQGGTGLGLSIVHGLTRDHGGTVTIESKPGKGTCVRVQLPLFEG